ncbi:hypothetical protein AALO_G00098500 [Alosa alosa]|uniref:Ig-like domain-containing protein n=1 Tax=Alosa alosa TaxID=278164 RepID=A0AAV6GV90_9TELE|nr:B-cell receptor CD22-like [Alosa alosa]KAG5278394.1 hypothetical protein AALO_G00098500 [Alosa alosa]
MYCGKNGRELLELISLFQSCRYLWPQIQSNNPTYIWYRNSQPVSNNHAVVNNILLLKPVSSEDAGNYLCVVKGYEDHPSLAVPLSVRFAPKNTIASIIHTSEVSEGSFVILTCSSDAYPPVHDYTWYRQNGLGTFRMGAGKTIHFTVALEDGGHYFCEAKNEVGSQNSTTMELTLAVSSQWTKGELTAIIIVPILALLVLATVVVTCWLRKTAIVNEDSVIKADVKQCTSNVYCSTVATISDPACFKMTPGPHVSVQHDEHYPTLHFTPSWQEVSLSSSIAKEHQFK